MQDIKAKLKQSNFQNLREKNLSYIKSNNFRRKLQKFDQEEVFINSITIIVF